MSTIWKMFGLAVIATVTVWGVVLGIVFLVQLISSMLAM